MRFPWESHFHGQACVIPCDTASKMKELIRFNISMLVILKLPELTGFSTHLKHSSIKAV